MEKNMTTLATYHWVCINGALAQGATNGQNFQSLYLWLG